MPLIDYHVHTRLCNHAKGPMEAYVRRAAELGLSEIGFLDHLTLRAEDRGHSMTPQEVPLYFGAVNRLKKKYAGQIRVRAGMELDFDPNAMDKAREMAERFSFDLIVCSVHFLNGWNMVSRRTRNQSPFENRNDLIRAYIQRLDLMLEAPFFDVVGHMDVVKKFGVEVKPELLPLWEKLVKKIAEKGLSVEVNTSGFTHPAKRSYPGKRLLDLLHGAGVGVTMGSDSHDPSELGRDYGRAVALLKDSGYSHLCAFSKRTKHLIPLD